MIDTKKIGFLFDLDGVLIDSEREYTRIWSTIEKEYPTGIEGFPIKIKGMTLPEILHEYFPASQHAEITERLYEMEQKMHYEWLPGAKELLLTLRDKGYPRVLVTSSNGDKMRHLYADRPDLAPLFDDIVTADRISHSKPDPEGYLLGASLAGADPRRCAVFEDSAQGVKAGNAAGAFVIGLTTTLPAEKVATHSQKVIEDLSDIDIDEIVKILLTR